MSSTPRSVTSAEVPNAVVKIVEVVGSSDESFSEAVRVAVRTAAQTIRQIRGVDVLSWSATVGPDGEFELFKANCKIAFLVEPPSGPRLGDGEVLSQEDR
jgi:flavin-binding protein dodecin